MAQFGQGVWAITGCLIVVGLLFMVIALLAGLVHIAPGQL
jgi:hypothetical protein